MNEEIQAVRMAIVEARSARDALERARSAAEEAEWRVQEAEVGLREAWKGMEEAIMADLAMSHTSGG